MFTMATNLGSFFYNGLQRIINAEATYVNARQQSARTSLPNGVINIAEGVSYAIKGATAAVVLGYGAPLPITALMVLNLFPYNTFSYIASKVKWVGDEINKLLSSSEQVDDDLFGRTKIIGSNSIDVISYLPSIKSLEIVQYIVTNGLILYQNLLPVNWFKMITVRAVEQPFLLYYGGALPKYYINNAISDWVWTLSGITAELLQSSKILSNTFQDTSVTNNYYDYNKRIPYTFPDRFLGISSYSSLTTVNWINNDNVFKTTTIIACLYVPGTSNSFYLMLPYLFYSAEAVNYNFNALCNVINPVSNQVIEVNSEYTHSLKLKNVFSRDIAYFNVTEINKFLLPNWMTLDRQIGAITIPDSIWGISVFVEIAYVAGFSSGLQIINISNPQNPVILGNIVFSSVVQDVVVIGEIAYVAATTGGVKIVNVSNAKNPILLRTILTVDRAEGISIVDDTIYVAANLAGIQIINNTQNLEYSASLGSIDIPGGYTTSIAITGNIAYVGTLFYGLQIINISNANHLILLRSMQLDTNPQIASICVVGKKAFIAADSLGLQIMDIGDPRNPTLLGSIRTAENIIDVTVVNEIAYVTADVGGLQIINISDVKRPTLLGSILTCERAIKVKVEEKIAYVTTGVGSMRDGQGGLLQIINVSNSVNPILLGSIVISVNKNIGGWPSGIELLNKIAYVAGSTGGLQIINVSDAQNPTLLSSLAAKGTSISITIKKDIAYVAGGECLQIINISNPKLPKLLTNIITLGNSNGIIIKEELAYIIANSGGLQIINVSNIQLPIVLDSVANSGRIYRITVVKNLAYITSETGLQIVNISDIKNPVLLKNIQTPVKSLGISIIKNVAFMVLNSGVLQIINVSLPQNSTLLGEIIISTWASGVTVQGGIAYVTVEQGIRTVNLDSGNIRMNPTIANVGIQYPLEVTVFDYYADTCNGNFVITVDQFPQINDNRLSLHSLFPKQNLLMSLISNVLFVGEGFLTLSATVKYGKALPAWLQLNVSPGLIGNYDNNKVSINKVVVIKSIVYLVDNTGLKIIDIRIPAKPNLIGSYGTIGTNNIQIVSNRAYLSDIVGLKIVNIEDPTKPVFIGSYTRPGITDFSVLNNIAYLAVNDWGLQVVNISDPVKPCLLNGYKITGASSILITNAIAYVVGANGLKIIDISNPFKSNCIGYFKTSFSATSITLIDDIGYLASNNFGLQMINISDPKNIIFLGGYVTKNINNMLLVDDIALMLETVNLEVINTSKSIGYILGSTPTSRCVNKIGVVGEKLGSIATSQIYSLTITSEVAYIAIYGAVQIINVSSSQNPVLLGTILVPNELVWDVTVVANNAYLISSSSGLQIVNVSNPLNPVLQGSLRISGNTYKVTVVENLAYVVTYSGFLRIINVSNPKYPALINSMASFSFGSSVASIEDVAVVGKIAYIAAYSYGLQIINMSNPLNPVLLGNIKTVSNAIGIKLLDGIAYLVQGSNGLQIINVTDVRPPTLIGNINTVGNAYGISVIGETAYIAAESGGLQIINISDPEHTLLLGKTLNFDGYDVKVIGEVAYIAAVSSLLMFNISDVKNPTLLGNIITPSYAVGVTIIEKIAYVAAYSSGLQIINISNTLSPVLLGTINTYSNARGVAVVDEIAYVAISSGGLQIINISDPGNMVSLNRVLTAGSAYGVNIVGDLAYIAETSFGIQVFNISDVLNPMLLKNIQVPSFTMVGVIVIGKTAYVASYSGGLKIINIGDVRVPTLLASIATPDYIQDVNVIKEIMYVADNSYGLRVFNISNLRNPVLLDSVATSGKAVGLEVFGNVAYVAESTGLEIIDVSILPYASLNIPNRFFNNVIVVNKIAYIAAGYGGLQIINISDVGNPVLLGSIIFNYAWKTAIVEKTAYVATSLGLQIINISQSENFSLLGSIPISKNANSYCFDVTVVGELAYVACGILGLQIINISDVGNPVLLGSQTSSTSMFVVKVEGGVAYVGASYNANIGGLQIFNISNPRNPVPLKNIPISYGDIYDLVIIEKIVYAGINGLVSGGGLQIINVSDPLKPVLLGNIILSGSANAVTVQGELAYVAAKDQGLQIINISDPKNPSLIEKIATADSAYDVKILDGIAYVAVAYQGLQIIDLRTTQNSVLANYNAVSANITGIMLIDQTIIVIKDNLQLVNINTLFNISLSKKLTKPQASNNIALIDTLALAPFNAALQIFDCARWILTGTPQFSDVGNTDIVITATDPVGVNVSDVFQIRIEGPPQIHKQISMQYAKVGQAFNYFIPQGIFFDPNFDPLTFTATLFSNQSLPEWLRFSNVAAMFAGTPPQMIKSNLTIMLSATDNIAGSISLIFGLYIDHIPQLNIPITDQVAGVNVPYNFKLITNTFVDLNDDPLFYAVRLTNGSLLPHWLNFDSDNLIFSGVPDKCDIGSYAIQIIVRDPFPGSEVSTSFHLLVKNFPKVVNPIGNQLAGIGKLFVYNMPANTFDYDDVGYLTYYAKLTSKEQWPSWLNWQSGLLQLKGTPSSSSDKGILPISIIATDQYGGAAISEFNLTVEYFPKLVNPLPNSLLAEVDKLFSYSIPINTFKDEENDPLRYNAQLSTGGLLPDWLTFNVSSKTLIGIPSIKYISVQGVGIISLQILAIDPYNGTAISNNLDIIVDKFPVIINTIEDQLVSIDREFEYRIPVENVFSDLYGKKLIYDINSERPFWLKWQPNQLKLTGIPTRTDRGKQLINITANDLYGAMVNTAFYLIVEFFPNKKYELSPAPIREDKLFNFYVPSNTFEDQGGNQLIYTANLQAGTMNNRLPNWLSFRPISDNVTYVGIFSGRPPIGSVNSLSILLTASHVNNVKINATINFIFKIVPNYTPIAKEQILCSLAEVNKFWKCDIPDTTFTNPNVDGILTYSIQQNTLEWLYFNNISKVLFGTPGKWDVDFFRDRVSYIALVATDEPLFSSTQIKITVTGESFGEWLLKILGSIASVFATVYGYCKYGYLFVNYKNKNKYQKQQEITITIGETTDEIEHKTIQLRMFMQNHDVADTVTIDNIVAIKEDVVPRYKFWKSPIKNDHTIELKWLSYTIKYEPSKESYQLQTIIKNGGPTANDLGVFTIIVQNQENKMRESFKLRVLNQNDLRQANFTNRIIGRIKNYFCFSNSYPSTAYVEMVGNDESLMIKLNTPKTKVGIVQAVKKIDIPIWKFWKKFGNQGLCYNQHPTIPIFGGALLPYCLKYNEKDKVLKIRRNAIKADSVYIILVKDNSEVILEKFELKLVNKDSLSIQSSQSLLFTTSPRNTAILAQRETTGIPSSPPLNEEQQSKKYKVPASPLLFSRKVQHMSSPEAIPSSLSAIPLGKDFARDCSSGKVVDLGDSQDKSGFRRLLSGSGGASSHNGDLENTASSSTGTNPVYVEMTPSTPKHYSGPQ